MKVDEVARLRELAGLGRPGQAAGQGQAVGDRKASFAQVLKQSLAEVSNLQQEADQAIQQLATGNKASLHETMIALEKADLSFRLMMQVRNKIVQAYQEIMRMTV